MVAVKSVCGILLPTSRSPRTKRGLFAIKPHSLGVELPAPAVWRRVTFLQLAHCVDILWDGLIFELFSGGRL